MALSASVIVAEEGIVTLHPHPTSSSRGNREEGTSWRDELMHLSRGKKRFHLKKFLHHVGGSFLT